MAIKYNKATKEFHLYNTEISYIFCILDNFQPGHVYFGGKITHRNSFRHMYTGNERAYTIYENLQHKHLSNDILKREYPDYGRGDYSEGAFSIIYKNGSIIFDFRYNSFKIYDGKSRIDDGKLPSTYMDNKNEGETLEIKLIDNLTQIELYLSYTIYNDRPVLTRNCRFTNKGSSTVKLQKVMSMSLDFDDMNFDMVQLSGAWARENHIETNKLRHGSQSIGSTRGASSHQHNPFVALKRFGCSELSGEVYGFNLVYSGNFKAEVTANHYNQTRIMMGINDFNFTWLLEPDTDFASPEVVMVYSNKGLNYMSQAFHSLYRERLINRSKRTVKPPVVINNWEATYFNFNEEKLLKIAETACKVGIETFVLDDGWFKNRNNDQSGLGDWEIDYLKLPDGLKGLGAKFKNLGINLGIWVEPESVSEQSELYSKHPEWVIQTPGRTSSLGRNQYLLDYTNQEVIDHIFGKLHKLIDGAEITYMKWDMNRNITEPFSETLTADRQGEFMHRYILGVYKLLDKLTGSFPLLIIESCAGGGGRFDPAMLAYSPITWTSDNTDAVDRITIQKGTSLCYPIRSMGSHVSGIPNHQIGRYSRLKTRINTAIFGAYGFQLDITKLNQKELDLIKSSIDSYKSIREVICEGLFYRLETQDTNIEAWMLVSRDQKLAVFGVYQILARANPPINMIRLTGLNADYLYKNIQTETKYYGDELMKIGLIFNNESHYYVNESDLISKNQIGAGDFTSELIYLTA